MAGGWLNLVNEMKADTKRTLAVRDSSDWPSVNCRRAVTDMTTRYETMTDVGLENFTPRSNIIRYAVTS